MYQPLDIVRREIRLLEIEPAEFDDAISCNLHTVSLDDDPSYEALSYVWGDPTIRDTVSVQGSLVRITTSLRSALQYLRYPDKPRFIWADAICINQDDLGERSAQVVQMGDIYRGAACVVVWLGGASPDSDLAMDCFELMGSDWERHWHLSPEQHTAISGLLNRSWWRRLWTVQESVLAQELRFLCGTKSLAWPTLRNAANSYSVHFLRFCCEADNAAPAGPAAWITAMNLPLRLSLVRTAHQGCQRTPLAALVADYRHFSCADPRDKIYGLLGLARREESLLVKPDYTKPAHKILEDAVIQLVQTRGSEGALALSLVIPPVRYRPSWVFDLSADRPLDDYLICRLRGANLGLYSAATVEADRCWFRYQDPGLLRCRICTVGVIAGLSSSRTNCDDVQWADMVRSWRRMAGVDNAPDAMYPIARDTHLTSGSCRIVRQILLQDAFAWTLCGSLAWEEITQSGLRPMARDMQPYRGQPRDCRITDRLRPVIREAYHEWWARAVEGKGLVYKGALGGGKSDDAADSELVRMFAAISYQTTYGRRLCFIDTDHGIRLLGLVPVSAEVGDIVVLIEGGRVPYVVRKGGVAAGTDHSGWSFVGDSYVEGVMDGEWMHIGKMEDAVLV